MSAAPKVFRPAEFIDKDALPDWLAPKPLGIVAEYAAHGIKCCPIPPGGKRPLALGWNLSENALKVDTIIPDGAGVGMLHVASQTCAIDVDDWAGAVALFKERGLDLQSYFDAPDSVAIESGKADHGKLIFRLTEPLPRTIFKADDGRMLLEFRCATMAGLNHQDCLPPTVHPGTGKPYRWAGNGDWRKLPTLPPEIRSWWLERVEEPIRTSKALMNDAIRRFINGRFNLDENTTVVAADGADRMTVFTSDDPIDDDYNWADLRAALTAIDPDCDRDTWRNVGFALHHLKTIVGAEQAVFELYVRWSSLATRMTYSDVRKPVFPGESKIRKEWEKYKSAGGITYRNLFWIARENYGWEPQNRALLRLFDLPAADGEARGVVPLRSDLEPWTPPEDVLAKSDFPESYQWGELPKVYERFMRAQLAMWPDNSPEIYAGMFNASIAAHVPPTVQVQVAHGNARMMPLCTATAIVEVPGSGKNATMNDALGNKDGGTLQQWSAEVDHSAAMDNAKAAAEADFRKRHKPEAMIADPSLAVPVPAATVMNNKKRIPGVRITGCSIEGLADIIADNLHYGAPTSLVSSEMYNALCNAGAHHAQAFKSMSDPVKAMLDGEAYAHRLKGVKLAFPVSAFNLCYATNYDSFGTWDSLSEFLGDGLAYRHNFFGAGKPVEGAYARDPDGVAGWEQLQRRLHQLKDVKLMLARDAEVEAELASLTAKARKYQSASRLMGWLSKLQAKFSVTCATMMLATHLERVLGGGEVEIPGEVQRRALTYLTGFVLEQQRHFYQQIEIGGAMDQRVKWNAKRIARRAADGVYKISSQYLYGDKAQSGYKNMDPRDGRLLVALLIDKGYIWPVENRQSNWVKPEDAKMFEVNPAMREVFDKYLDEIRDEHAMRVEKMRSDFAHVLLKRMKIHRLFCF